MRRALLPPAVLVIAALFALAACSQTDHPKPADSATAALPGRSQSAAEAARDGVVEQIAALSFTDRVSIGAETEVDGGRWVVSHLPIQTLATIVITEASSHAVGGSELLHLDGERIVRAVPLPGAPTTWIAAAGQTIYAGRIGDGAVPATSVVRVDVPTGETTRLIVPWSYAHSPLVYASSGWRVATPSAGEAVRSALEAAMDEQRGPETLEKLDAAIAAALSSPALELPKVSDPHTTCDFSQAVYLDTRYIFAAEPACAFGVVDPSTRRPFAVVAGKRIEGQLVGHGRTDPAGGTHAAIVAADTNADGDRMLVLVDTSDPSRRWDTGIVGASDAMTMTHVSFFDGGLITTSMTGQHTSLHRYDIAAQSIEEVSLPAAISELAQADRFTDYVAVSPDGTLVASAEFTGSRDQAMSAERIVTIVVRELATGEEARRISLDVAAGNTVDWLDFDGRWALVTFSNREAAAAAEQQWPLMVDTVTSEIYPLGFEIAAHVTFAPAR